jgi:hypothetical protein
VVGICSVPDSNYRSLTAVDLESPQRWSAEMTDFRGKTWGVNVKELDILVEFGDHKTVEVVRVTPEDDLRTDRVKVWVDDEGTIIHVVIR